MLPFEKFSRNIWYMIKYLKTIVTGLYMFLALSTCSTVKSGLSIPAYQTFILGELNDSNYTAILKNTSEYSVLVRGIDKNSDELIQEVLLLPKQESKINIRKSETVYFINDNDIEVKIDVKLSKGVEGMRYEVHSN